jgi:hypothetical protein
MVWRPGLGDKAATDPQVPAPTISLLLHPSPDCRIRLRKQTWLCLPRQHWSEMLYFVPVALPIFVFAYAVAKAFNKKSSVNAAPLNYFNIAVELTRLDAEYSAAKSVLFKFAYRRCFRDLAHVTFSAEPFVQSGHWTQLYNSDSHGLSCNRFQHHCFRYRGQLLGDLLHFQRPFATTTKILNGLPPYCCFDHRTNTHSHQD